jgi:hypothetical protein
MKDWSDLKIRINRSLRTYVWLRAVARESLKLNTESGAMAASVFAAFAAEAYFNHIGQDRIGYWEKSSLESLSPLRKADLLNGLLLSRSVDWSRRPYQTLAEGIGYRNSLAHGKTERTTASTTFADIADDLISSAPEPQAKWQRILDIKVATRLVEDIEQLIEEMHASLGYAEPPFPTSDEGGA